MKEVTDFACVAAGLHPEHFQAVTPDTGATHSSSSTEAPPGCTPPCVAVQQQVASSPVLQMVEVSMLD